MATSLFGHSPIPFSAFPGSEVRHRLVKLDETGAVASHITVGWLTPEQIRQYIGNYPELFVSADEDALSRIAVQTQTITVTNEYESVPSFFKLEMTD